MALKSFSEQVFAPNDPFKPSLHYGVKHITSRRPDDNDLYAPPTLLQAPRRHGEMRPGAAHARGGDWGYDRWGRSHDDRALIPGRAYLSPNGRSGRHNLHEEQKTEYIRQPPAQPAWRTVRRHESRERRGSPERHPAHEAFESPVKTPSPPSRRDGRFYGPLPHRRSRSPSSKRRSESVYSSRSRASPSRRRQPQSIDSRAASPPNGMQFELAVPNTSAPVATPAIVERTSGYDSGGPPLARRHDLGRTTHTQSSASFSEIQAVPSEISTSDRQPSQREPSSLPVFEPVDHHDHSKSPSLLRPTSRPLTLSARAESSLGSLFQMIKFKRVTPMTSWSVIDAVDIPLAHTVVGSKPEHTSAPAEPVVDMSRIATQTYVKAFVLDTLPRQLYTYALLRLPHMYFSRVTRIFEEAELSMPQIKQGIVEAFIQRKGQSAHSAWMMEPPTEVVGYSTLSTTWDGFIDSVLREWKTLNIISVLLLSAILTMLQLDGAGTDPLIRFTALLSMVCALMSLLYGCMFIIRFGTMRRTYKAAEWANEAQRSRTGIFWNVWVLLAMPATWLAWSMILYIICIMSFIWRTGTVSDATRGNFTAQQALAGRITISVTLGLGLTYFFLILGTLKRYGDAMDRAWQQRISGWINDQKPEVTPEDPFLKPEYVVSMPRPTSPHAWGTWMPDPNVQPSPVGDGTEKSAPADPVPSQHLEHKRVPSMSTNRHEYTSNWVAGQHDLGPDDPVPSQHLEHKYVPSMSTNRHEYTNNWVAGQHDLGPDLSIPVHPSPEFIASAIEISNPAPQSHEHIPWGLTAHVTHSTDSAPETTPIRPLLRPISPLRTTVAAESGSDMEAKLYAYDEPKQLSGANIQIKSLPNLADAEISRDRPFDANAMKITNHGSNLVYMARFLRLPDTSVRMDVLPPTSSALNGVKLRSLPLGTDSDGDSWQELAKDIQLSWTPDDFLPMHQILQKWNNSELRSQNLQMALCKEVQTSGAESLAIYSFSLSYPLQMVDPSAFVLPPHLRALEIFTQPLLKDDSVRGVIKIEWDCQSWVEKSATD